MKGWMALLATSVVLACSGGEPQVADRDSAAQRTRDSAIGASGLPGATGITSSLKVADSAAARRQREDSIATSP